MIDVKMISKSGIKPSYATDGSAGVDLPAYIDVTIDIPPFNRRLIPTGLYMAIPKGHVGLVCPRSGLAIKKGLTVLNAPGVIDGDFRGEIGVILINLSNEVQSINPGDRIAQLVISKYEKANFQLTNSLDETERGSGGFGSTGA